MTLSSLRNSKNIFNLNDIAVILDGKKKKEIGYFIPSVFKDEFQKFTAEFEHKKKINLLKRVASASKKDIIGDGTISDGIM